MTDQITLRQDDQLILLHAKSMVCQYGKTAEGADQLQLFYGHKEIVFDDPRLFAFGETLARQQRFAAAEAARWGRGYTWDQVRPLLQHLIDEQVLRRAETTDGAATVDDARYAGAGGVCGGEHDDRGDRDNPLPPAVTTEAHSWIDCAAITEKLAGTGVESSYLEMILPVFRVAHVNLDAEGRQVGEANVFPQALRLDIKTRWRRCPQAGSRYRADRPMNVTALKSMRRYWPHILYCLHRIRRDYLRRFPLAQKGWSVGHMERLSTIVLALPAYLMMVHRERVENGRLHPVLSCMFRVTDGLRLTLHQMLFFPLLEKTLDPDTPMDARRLYEYAERNYAFYSQHGVCAGPRAMIEEFLSVMFDGADLRPPADLHQDVRFALRRIPQAFEYGLLGLQIYAVVFSLWPAMARGYESLWRVLESWQNKSPAFIKFKETIAGHVADQRGKSLIGDESLRQSRDRAYQDMYAQSAAGLNTAGTGASLRTVISAPSMVQHAEARQRLREICRRRFQVPGDDNHLDRLAGVLMDCFRQEQGILRAALPIQEKINALLGRPEPQRPFYSAQFDVYNRFLGDISRLPYLPGVVARLLGFEVMTTCDRIDIR